MNEQIRYERRTTNVYNGMPGPWVECDKGLYEALRISQVAPVREVAQPQPEAPQP